MSDYNVDRTSHIDIADNPDVRVFLENCDYMKAPTYVNGKNADDIITTIHNVVDDEDEQQQ